MSTVESTFRGLIDNLRIYNRALTAAEIQQDMATPVGGSVADTTPPVESGGAPSGTLPAGTTQTTLSLSTNEAATCRYSTVAGTSYAAMTNVFTTTGGVSHSTLVAGLLNGQSYTYYVRCQDVAGNANTSDFPISFSVASTVDTTPPVESGGAPSGVLAAGTTQTTLSLNTQRGSDLSLQHSGGNELRSDDECVHDNRGAGPLDVGRGVGKRTELHILRSLPGRGWQPKHE